jgi:hypothetical protein
MGWGIPSAVNLRQPRVVPARFDWQTASEGHAVLTVLAAVAAVAVLAFWRLPTAGWDSAAATATAGPGWVLPQHRHSAGAAAVNRSNPTAGWLGARCVSSVAVDGTSRPLRSVGHRLSARECGPGHPGYDLRHSRGISEMLPPAGQASTRWRRHSGSRAARWQAISRRKGVIVRLPSIACRNRAIACLRATPLHHPAGHYRFINRSRSGG